MRAAIVGALLVGTAADAAADRIFYRADTWLETSPDVQRLSVIGVLNGWARVAAEAEEAALAGVAPSHRQREAFRLIDCLTGPTRRAVPEIQERVTAFASVDPTRVFYSLSDFLAASLQSVCPAR
ncbi:MAG: hypothetical protein ACRELA_17780 [Candidatus Rokuibacteriota bacterium]